MRDRYTCRSNLDDFTGTWPTDFVFPPRVGDRVKSKEGRTLYVVGVEHYERHKTRSDGGWRDPEPEPRVIVELHNFESVPR